MVKKIKKFDHTEIEKYKFPQHKGPVLTDNIDIIVVFIAVSNKASFGKKGFKYFFGYENAK